MWQLYFSCNSIPGFVLITEVSTERHRADRGLGITTKLFVCLTYNFSKTAF